MDLKKELVQIDQEIGLEVKRRNESISALDVLFRDRLQQVKNETKETLNARIESLLVTAAELNKHVDKLAESIDESKRNFPKYIEEKTSDIVKQITEFKAKFEADRTTQSEKMEIIQKIITEQEYRLNHQLQSERVQRSQKYDELLQATENETRKRLKTEESLKNYLQEQINVIQQQADASQQNREETMEELVKAFVHYTSALQDGMNILAEST